MPIVASLSESLLKLACFKAALAASSVFSHGVHLQGRLTASCNACLALSSPVTSFHFTLGFSLIIAELTPALNLTFSESSPSPRPFFGFDVVRDATAPSPLDVGPPPTSSRTARISSALLKYSTNFWIIASLIFGFFSYYT
ncbi:hypothetical protein FXO37_35103 [Capsicum annuum]|nr:hypothetical protein FXO37_35103 [Capsicum annuum]